jgi:hypothetical protein
MNNKRKMKKIKIKNKKKKRNPHTLLVGMQAGATTLEKNLKAS